MDIPLAIPWSKELLPNLLLQERSLVKKVVGIRKRNEMNGQKKKSKQTKTLIKLALCFFSQNAKFLYLAC